LKPHGAKYLKKPFMVSGRIGSAPQITVCTHTHTHQH
jgi:hypothetical protein